MEVLAGFLGHIKIVGFPVKCLFTKIRASIFYILATILLV